MLVYMRTNAVSAGRTISLECHCRVGELPSLEMIMTVANVLLHVVGRAYMFCLYMYSVRQSQLVGLACRTACSLVASTGNEPMRFLG